MSIAESYEDFIASLEEKGVPNPRVLVPALAVLAVLAIGYFAFSGGIPSVTAPPSGSGEKKALELSVRDSATGAGVPNAAVTLYFADGQTQVDYTDSSGKASFSGVPTSGLRVKISATNYNDFTGEVPSSKTLSLTSAASTPSQLTAFVQVRDSNDDDVQGAFVTLSTPNGEILASQLTNAFGEANLKIDSDSVPSVANVKVEKDGFKTTQKMVSESELNDVIYVTLESSTQENFEEAKDGKLVVYVNDEDGAAVEGATASIADFYTGKVIRVARSAADGTAAFEKIAFGTKFSLLVKAEGFEDYASDEEEFSEANTEFYASLTTKVVPDPNELAIAIVDAGGAGSAEPVEYAVVSVYDRSTRALLAEQATDDKGEAVFSLTRGKTFFVTARADGFLPGALEVVQAGAPKTLALEREAAGNYFDVPVTVRVEGEPAANALVALYRADGFPLGAAQQNADADGVTEFRVPAKLKGSDYELYASASFDALHGKSDLSLVVEGIELFVNLAPDPAVLRVEARDASTNESIDGALFSLKPSSGGEQRSCTAAGGAGNASCEIAVAPNQEFVVTASAADYLPSTTASLVLAPGENSFLSIRVYPLALSRSAGVRFEGLFDAEGRSVKEVQNAAFYEARFLATLPKAAEQAFFYASVGEAVSADEDSAAFSSVDADGVKFVYSGVNADDDCAASDAGGEATPAESEEGGEAESAYASETLDGLKKWFNVEMPANFVGTKEFALRLFVKASAKAGSKIVFKSRLAGSAGGAPFVSPASDDAIAALSSKLESSAGAALEASDYCSAPTRSDSVKVAKNLLYCDSGLCSSLVFEDESGNRFPESFSAKLGDEFFLSYVIASEDKEITAITVTASDALRFYGRETVVLNMSGGGGESSAAAIEFAEDGDGDGSEDSSSTSFTARAQPGERISGLLRFKALKSSANAVITLKVAYSDKSAEPALLQSALSVTGSNSFRVELKPSTLVAGLAENARATVRDSFGASVVDANLLFYECDGSPLNGQELQIQGDDSINRGADGVYRARLSASSVGTIGLRVSREGFKTFDECPIEVVAGEFLTVQPETLKFKGDSSAPDALTKEVALYSSIPVRSRVSASVDCASKSLTAQPEYSQPPLYVVPQSFYLKDSAKAQIAVVANATGDYDCAISFRAEVNPKNVFTATVYASVSLTTPPVIDYCPTDAGYNCVSPVNVPKNCFAQPQFECKKTGSSSSSVSSKICVVCDYGMHTLPESFELGVGVTKSTDSQSADIAFDSKPKCKLEGFESYSSKYSRGLDSDYWSYQTNGYSPQSPWGGAGSYSPYSYQDYYGSAYGGAYGGAYGSYGMGYDSGYGGSGYGSGYSSGYGSAGGGLNFGYGYGAGYGYGSNALGYGYGSGAYGTYCPQTLNTQSMYSSYYSNSYQSPWSTGIMPGNPVNCQYPYVCQSGASAYCSFTAGGASGSYYGFSAGYSQYGSACSYPAICYNPSGCSSYGGYGGYGGGRGGYGRSYNYHPSKPPVRVTVGSCTASEITVTAEYTGNDYYYNGAVGGEQNGFVVVTWKGESKKIPVKVKVAAPTQLTPARQPPIVFTPQFPMSCVPLPASQKTGLDEYGLPDDEITIKVNAFTGKGAYERGISLARSVLCRNFKVEDKAGDVKDESCSSSKLAFKITYSKKSGAADPAFASLSDSGSFQALVTGGVTTEPREYSFSVEADDLVPNGKILLYSDRKSFDSDEKDYLEKAKCSVSGVSGVKVSCKNNVLKVSWDGASEGKGTLKVTNAGDYNVREIPLATSKQAQPAIEGVKATYYLDEKKMAFEGLAGIPSDYKKDLSVKVFKDACGVGNQFGSYTYALKPDPAKPDEAELPLTLADAKITSARASELSFEEAWAPGEFVRDYEPPANKGADATANDMIFQPDAASTENQAQADAALAQAVTSIKTQVFESAVVSTYFPKSFAVVPDLVPANVPTADASAVDGDAVKVMKGCPYDSCATQGTLRYIASNKPGLSSQVTQAMSKYASDSSLSPLEKQTRQYFFSNIEDNRWSNAMDEFMFAGLQLYGVRYKPDRYGKKYFPQYVLELYNGVLKQDVINVGVAPDRGTTATDESGYRFQLTAKSEAGASGGARELSTPCTRIIVKQNKPAQPDPNGGAGGAGDAGDGSGSGGNNGGKGKDATPPTKFEFTKFVFEEMNNQQIKFSGAYDGSAEEIAKWASYQVLFYYDEKDDAGKVIGTHEAGELLKTGAFTGYSDKKKGLDLDETEKTFTENRQFSEVIDAALALAQVAKAKANGKNYFPFARIIALDVDGKELARKDTDYFEESVTSILRPSYASEARVESSEVVTFTTGLTKDSSQNGLLLVLGPAGKQRKVLVWPYMHCHQAGYWHAVNFKVYEFFEGGNSQDVSLTCKPIFGSVPYITWGTGFSGWWEGSRKKTRIDCVNQRLILKLKSIECTTKEKIPNSCTGGASTDTCTSGSITLQATYYG